MPGTGARVGEDATERISNALTDADGYPVESVELLRISRMRWV